MRESDRGEGGREDRQRQSEERGRGGVKAIFPDGSRVTW